MEDDASPKFFGEIVAAALRTHYLAIPHKMGLCIISDMIQSKGFHSRVNKFEYDLLFLVVC